MSATATPARPYDPGARRVAPAMPATTARLTAELSDLARRLTAPSRPAILTPREW